MMTAGDAGQELQRKAIMENPAKTDHPIHELLRRRWSPRAFDPRPVEPEKLKCLLEAARWAPSSYNEQPWAFIVGVKSQPAEHAKVLEAFIEFNRSWAGAAPIVMLSVAHLNFDKNGHPNPHAFHDIGLAAANLTVQATSMGLCVHQMAGILPDRAREIFGIPADWDALTGIAIGYPGDPNSLAEPLRQRELAERTRKSLPSFVFSSSWGTSAAVLS
jgi:nitroreductase